MKKYTTSCIIYYVTWVTNIDIGGFLMTNNQLLKKWEMTWRCEIFHITHMTVIWEKQKI